MGYTHYFTQKKDCPLAQWASLKAAVLTLYGARPPVSESAGECHEGLLTLCDGNGEVELTAASQLFVKDPELGEILIFNGDDREDRNLAHETMLLSRKREPLAPGHPAGMHGFAFCKTAGKPYDWFVVAVLLLAEKHCPGVWAISSDGDAGDWQPVLVWLEANGFGAMKLPTAVAGE